MQRLTAIYPAVVFLVVVSGARADQDSGIEFFERKIRPVLVEHCYKCHSAKAKTLRAGLYVDSRSGLLKGGESGAAIVPGNPDESLLLAAIKHDGFEMPPSGRLPASVVADFEKWIQIGAPDPREKSGSGRMKTGQGGPVAADDLWSLQPIGDPQPPEVRDGEWPRDSIDRFVLRRMESKNIEPVRDADPTVLVRRLHFDLTGLPPSPEEVDRFVDDPSQEQLERLVDRLLDSPHFGERWGRHWLDVARFAESSGGGRTRIFTSAWRYRDYVIRSFNNDKPFDAFVREQVAGDLLPADSWEHAADQLVGTMFLALGPINYELQDKVLLRMEVVDEQLDTVGRSFLGMTIGCARCHDHKFDPIPTRDYYAMAGILRSTQTLTPGNVAGSVMRALPLEPERQAELDRYEQARAELEAGVETSKARAGELESQRDQLIGADPESGVTVDDADAKLVGDWKRSTSIKGFVRDGYIHDAAEGKGEKSVTFIPALTTAGRYEVRLAYTAASNREPKVPVTVHSSGEPRTIQVNQKQQPPIDGTWIRLGEFEFESGREGRVVVSNQGTTATVIADAVRFIPLEPPTSSEPVDRERLARRKQIVLSIAANQKQLRAQQKKLKELNDKAPDAADTIMSVEDRDDPEDCPVHIRGNVRNLGDVVPRGFLTAARFEHEAPTEGSGRLQLANWLADSNNPLTSRVIANRVWQNLFGRGLVSTPDNFGMMGEPPTHPELLDRLARDLTNDGWSIKRLIRRIVLSRTYGLSSESNDSGTAADRDNLLLWRHNRRRLQAECLRDAILSVSGRLETEPPAASLVKPGTKSEFGYTFEENHRSVYVPVFRNTLHPLLEVFDVADPNLVVGRRKISTLPTQALFLMNSPFVMEQAGVAAGRLLSETSDDRSGRIQLAYRRTLGRGPTPDEFRLADDFLSETSDSKDTWIAVFQALFSSIDFRYVD